MRWQETAERAATDGNTSPSNQLTPQEIASLPG